GILGVLLPLYVLKRMHEQEIELNYHIELIAFGDEEGVRFPKTLLGSKSLCGDVCSADLEVVDKDGVTLKSALEFLGANTNEITKCAYDKDDVLGFFEVHIEQGPVLESESLPVGVVTAITGIERHRLFIQGKANHAGTTPMDMRQDALVTASHIICFANDLFCNTENLVGVVGELNVYPNAVNVIPDRVDLTVEIRSPDKKIRQEAAEKIYQYANKLASEQNTAINFNHNYEMDGIKCDEKLQSILGEAIEKNNRPVFHLFSGAGHDGLAMDRLTGVAMLFLRCKEGLSHHHEEDIDYHDAIIAAEVIETFLLELEEA
ncbi:hydantoinase/carbamoylase family amidase, partial [Fangia hongkongensis]